MISLDLTDIIGLAGVVAYIAAYFIVQVLHQPPSGKKAVTLNIIGPVCILISLVDAFNMASFLTQCFWLGLTVIGWWRNRKTEQKGVKKSQDPAWDQRSQQ